MVAILNRLTHCGGIVTLSLFLLGPFLARVRQDHALALSSKKAQALLAYLALEAARPHYREALSGLLWPERPDQAARGSLRQALQELRRAIGDNGAFSPLLLVSRETIQLNPDADYWLDVDAFEKRAVITLRESSLDRETADIEALCAAIALYRGPFLEGFSLGDSPAFEEWLLLKREQFNHQMLLALNALAALYEKHRAYDDALACVRRIIAMEPWQEEAHQHAMYLLTLAGRRGEALAQYRDCRNSMARELGVEPGSEITALYERIRDGAIPPSLLARTWAADKQNLPPHPVSTHRAEPPALVAREQELAKLSGLLSQALAGEGRVALITGEAGSGKTALVEEFARQAMATHSDLVVGLGRCSAYSGTGDPYQPYREIWRGLAGDIETTLNAEHTQRLRTALPLAVEALAQQGVDLAYLLMREQRSQAWGTWPTCLEALAAQVAPPKRPEIPLAALSEQATRVLRAVAQRLPVVLILDDLQWADGPSLEMLFYLGRHLQKSRILVVGTFRPLGYDSAPPGTPHPLAGIADEFQRLWGDIRVDLAQAEGRRFVDAYLDRWPNALSASFRETLTRHTGGNALFTVELVRAMQERGDLLRDGQGRWVEGSGLAWGRLPPRIEGAISQRISRLTATQKELLEIASIEGEEFHADVLASVCGCSRETIIASLRGSLGRDAHLVAPSGLVRLGERQLARYRFRHGMFQSYLYERLDAATRMHRHGAVAAMLEELYGKQATLLASQLARHYEVAGLGGKAAANLLEAGRSAARVGAHPEAIECYEHALNLLINVPEGAARTELEVTLQLAVDASLESLYGWGTSERLRTSGRAYQLGQQLGRTSLQRLRAIRSLADLSATRGEGERAMALANELLVAAEQAQEPLYIAAAQGILAICRLMRGELALAWEHAAQAVAARQRITHQPTAEDLGEWRPYAEFSASYVLLARGCFEQARQEMEQITFDPAWDARYPRVATESMAAMFYAVAHDDRLARQWAEKALRSIGNSHMPEAMAWCEQTLGWVEARAGCAPQGVARFLAATSDRAATGTVTYRFLRFVLLAETYLASGEHGQALETIEQAIVQAEQTGTRIYEAELWRLRGECLLQNKAAATGNAFQEAEGCFQHAIAVARQQGARLWELRATISMVRLWQGQGKGEEAREMLATLYGTFGEGFDTSDLREARALLSGGLTL
jgi:DNA-binding SARP family transcriptional activator